MFTTDILLLRLDFPLNTYICYGLVQLSAINGCSWPIKPIQPTPPFVPYIPIKSQWSQGWSSKCMCRRSDVLPLNLEPKRQTDQKKSFDYNFLKWELCRLNSIHHFELDKKKDNTFIVETHRNISGLSTFMTEANEKTTSAYDGCLLTPWSVPLLSSSPSPHSQLPGYLDSAGRAPSTTTNNLWLIKQGVGGP